MIPQKVWITTFFILWPKFFAILKTWKRFSIKYDVLNVHDIHELYFRSKAGFSFDSTGNTLTINSGSLLYSPSIVYQFIIQTVYMSTIYSQEVTFQIDSASIVPIASLKWAQFYRIKKSILKYSNISLHKDVDSTPLVYRMSRTRKLIHLRP